MTERPPFHFSLSCTGEGNGNPLQCSCLENPGDGGAWWVAVSGVAQSRTWLKRLSSSNTSNTLIRNGESGYPCLVPNFRGKAFNFSSLSMMLMVILSLYWYMFSPYLLCWASLLWMGFECCQMLSLHLFQPVVFISCSVFVWLLMYDKTNTIL